MKVGWFVLAVTVMVTSQAYMLHRYEKAVELRVWGEISEDATVRAKSESAWLGFSVEDVGRLHRVGKDYGIEPAILAGIRSIENGRLAYETGYSGWISRDIKIRYRDDPGCWQYASTAALMVHEGMKVLQSPEVYGLWLTKVGKRYNPRSTAWSRDVEDATNWYRTEASGGMHAIPAIRAQNVAALKRRGKR